MKTLPIFTASALMLLPACNGQDAATESGAASEDMPAETEFDQQLSEEEANAALDALEAEEAATTE